MKQIHVFTTDFISHTSFGIIFHTELAALVAR